MGQNLISPIYSLAGSGALRKQQQDQPEHTGRRDAVAQIERARKIKRSLGIAVAARYLKKRGWSLEATHYILLGYGASR
jgi:hypothetical protein